MKASAHCFGDLAGIGATCGGNGIVDPAKPLQGFLHQIARNTRIACIARHEGGFGHVAQIGEQPVHFSVAVAAIEDETHVALGKSHCNCGADASCTASDDRDFHVTLLRLFLYSLVQA